LDSLEGFHEGFFSKPLKKASHYTKLKGRKEESIGKVLKKLPEVKFS